MSAGIDMSALKDAEKELESRGGGGFFLRLGQDESKDIRILNPTASMNGLYFIELTQWWIGNTPIISSSFMGESDVVQDIIDDFKADFGQTEKGKKEFNTLLTAVKANGTKQVSSNKIFWLPILEFEWKINDNDEIEGIYDANGEYDVEKIKEFISGKKPKIFEAKVSLVKHITSLVTTGRGGSKFFTPDAGINLRVSRKGTGRDTVYSAQKDEIMPMPEEFYGAKALDPVSVAKGALYTDAHIEAVLANYFYGDKLPEAAEYRFPELRQKEEATEEEAPRRRRGQAAETTAEATPEPVEEEKAQPARARRSEKKEEPTTRGRRNLADDVAK